MNPELRVEIRDFARTRDWQRVHTPKNLSMALAGEPGELLAEFQWLTAEQSFSAAVDGEFRERVQDEIADIAIYLL